MPRSLALSRRRFLGGAAAAAGALPALRAQQLDFAPVDYHAHLDDTVTLEKALEISHDRGVKFGIVEHAGTKENKYPHLISDDACTLSVYTDHFKAASAKPRWLRPRCSRHALTCAAIVLCRMLPMIRASCPGVKPLLPVGGGLHRCWPSPRGTAFRERP